MKLQPELASYAGTVLYPDSESAKWDVDGMHQMMWNSNIVCVALSKKLFETKIEIRICKEYLFSFDVHILANPGVA